MNELKVYHCNEWHNECTEFYLKSDVGVVVRDRVRERGYPGAGPLARERAVAAVVVRGLKKYRVFYAITY